MPRILISAAIVSISLLGRAIAAEPQLAHMVYFTLAEDSDDAKETLVKGCRKFLAGHEGTVYFSAGVIAKELDRDVNDRDFHVALHVVFKDKAAHDKYQTHPRHLEFIEEYKSSWTAVRVFDSYHRAPAADKDPETTRRVPLPDPASTFAGMIRGKVIQKRDHQVVVMVNEVPREWDHSKADDAKALIGKPVLVDGREIDGRPAAPIRRFLAGLKVGDVVELDVAHRKGEALTVVELTEEQRQGVNARK